MRADIWLGVVTVFMAVLGGIVSAHAPTRLWHKILYVGAFVLAGAASVCLVIRISNENAAANTGLKNALDKLGETTTNIATMTALNTQLQERLLNQSDTIASLSKQNIATVTGADSFCFLGFNRSQGFLVFVHIGQFPLYGVIARITELDQNGKSRPNNLMGVTV